MTPKKALPDFGCHFEVVNRGVKGIMRWFYGILHPCQYIFDNNSMNRKFSIKKIRWKISLGKTFSSKIISENENIVTKE